MKKLALILTLLFPALVSAEDPWEMATDICREEVGEDLMARQHCLRDFQKVSYLVRRYYEHAGVFNEAGVRPDFSFSDMFQNPFVLSPRRVIEKCSVSQLFNGNLFSGIMDLRTVWECISDIDPEAARWDTI